MKPPKSQIRRKVISFKALPSKPPVTYILIYGLYSMVHHYPVWLDVVVYVGLGIWAATCLYIAGGQEQVDPFE